jgi:hypothetical protein
MPNEKMGSRRLPQPPDVAAGIVVIAVAGFLCFVALSMTGLFFYLRSSLPDAFRKVIEHHFPEPALQKNPQDDLRRFERDQRAMLSGYGWVDQSKGLVRIPIEEAMRIIAARGDHAYDPLDQPTSTSRPVAPDASSPDRVRP